MVKLSSNPTCVLSDADVITNEQAERIAKVLTKHLPGAGDVTETGKIVGVDANGDVSLVEDNSMPSTSGASQGDVLTVGSDGPEWAAPSGGESGVFVATYGVTRPSEIIAANNAGKVVICKRYNWIYTLVFTTPENGWYTVWFSQAFLKTPEMNDYPQIKCIKAIERVDSTDEDVPIWSGPYSFELLKASSYPPAARLVPVATASEAGQVLAVNAQGTPEWAAPSGGTQYSAGDGISIANDTISAKVDGTTIQVNASGELEAIGGGGSSASGYFVPFYSSYMQMLDTTVINSYGTHIDGVVGTRLTQHWYPGAISQISINLPASMGPANDIYKATLSILLEDTNDASNTVYLVRNTENTGVGLGDIPPNYSYGNLSFNFTIGPRDLPYNYSIKELTFRIEDITNSSQTMTLPGWNDLDSEMVERWSRNTAGIMLTQVPASITNV